MSEQDSNIRPTEDEDVEAHRKASKYAAADEAPKDDESEDDVELHGIKKGGQKAL